MTSHPNRKPLDKMSGDELDAILRRTEYTASAGNGAGIMNRAAELDYNLRRRVWAELERREYGDND